MIDWSAYTSELLALLDEIEVETKGFDEQIHDLALKRFEIAKRHGFTIERGWG